MFELDGDEIFNAGMLEEYIVKMIDAGKRNVAVDVSSVDCIYSDCINTLMTLNAVAANARGCIAIVNPRHKTAEIIRNAGIHTMLKVFNSDADLLAGSGWIKGANTHTMAESAPAPTAVPNKTPTKKQPAYVPPKPPRPRKTQKLKTYGAPQNKKSLPQKNIIIIVAAIVVVALCFIFIPPANKFARDTIAKIGGSVGGKGTLAPRGTTGDTPAPSFPPPVTSESERGDHDDDDDYVPLSNAIDTSNTSVAPVAVPVPVAPAPAAPAAVPAARNVPAPDTLTTLNVLDMIDGDI